MLGSKGPRVALQTPSVSLVISSGCPGFQSPLTSTFVALGARTLNVTRRSAWTSGEAGGEGCCAWDRFSALGKPAKQSVVMTRHRKVLWIQAVFSRTGTPSTMLSLL